MSTTIERIDEIDSQLLHFLQGDARVSNAALARELGMAPSAILERVRKLEERGLIQGYEARLNSAALGWGLVAFVFVRTTEALGLHDTAERLAAIPEVQEVHNVAGEDCYLVKLRVADTAALAALLRNEFGRIGTIHSTRTTIVLETIKERATLPIGNGSGGAANDQ
ncbi:MAG TPA: Lrp/AsnC family transcriptional regulator [Bryobacteraceae bacterium]|jgi:Lrp/AsnC family leucine-responsive transcriptional regulator